MKKVLLAVFLFSSTISFAQVKFGVKAGANFYNFTGSGTKDAGYDQSRSLKVGLVAGLISEIRLSKLFTLQPGVLYSQEGNKQAADGNKMVFNFDYINVPVMLQYRDKSGFFGETGPQIGFRVSAKAKVTESGASQEVDIKEQVKSTAFSWNVGCGWVFKNGLGINARSQWGLTNIIKEDGHAILNSGFNATLFYILK